jgi:hypothetical protein
MRKKKLQQAWFELARVLARELPFALKHPVFSLRASLRPFRARPASFSLLSQRGAKRSIPLTPLV